MLRHMLSRLIQILSRSSLSLRFFAFGCVVMLGAALVLGSWVSNRIAAGVTENYGAASALYFESLIPQLPFLQTTAETFSDDAKDELRQIFVEGTLGDQVVTYKVWAQDGTVLTSFDPLLEDRTFQVSEALAQAWGGRVAAEYEAVQLHELAEGTTIELPLLGVYVPIRNIVSGEVVTVIEFYRRAEGLLEDIDQARRQTWYMVSVVFLISGAFLFGIVHAGSRLIERQRSDLVRQLDQNHDLQERVAAAAARSTSQADRVMQRIGLDLHDGVAQHLSLLALRLEGAGLKDTEDATTVKDALANAMTELRAISRGLALPDIDALTLSETVKRAVSDHNKAFGTNARFEVIAETLAQAEPPVKLALYRVTQELLANTQKHAAASKVEVKLDHSTSDVTVTVSDDGVGFVSENPDLEKDSGQGLLGIRDRLLPLGGHLEIQSQPEHGTTAVFSLPHEGVHS